PAGIVTDTRGRLEIGPNSEGALETTAGPISVLGLGKLKVLSATSTNAPPSGDNDIDIETTNGGDLVVLGPVSITNQNPADLADVLLTSEGILYLLGDGVSPVVSTNGGQLIAATADGTVDASTGNVTASGDDLVIDGVEINLGSGEFNIQGTNFTLTSGTAPTETATIIAGLVSIGGIDPDTGVPTPLAGTVTIQSLGGATTVNASEILVSATSIDVLGTDGDVILDSSGST
ncbi:MAG: hypothetical protein GWN07_41525, partial [Actinobacteria bacterium]|nr:hypothetical protein [Actinomycetota bacterium]NIS37513.1 hypothetical protein [Actinomycetota bacterium]NIU71579.1 hypothetical protein [Actinomycetota bacterium]NIW33529.1 hypothetical protein [Actinomycetota bacterium]NIX25954.1 hypothetical protein [Actinomycetota bacterium]